MAWPDLIVASILAMLALTGGWQIIRQARGELQQVHHSSLRPAE
jgi:Co/Zn/Cd efflux system component